MSGRALVGWSGFVGQNLLAQAAFDARYRSTDIDALRGRSFDLVVCAGAPAAKWKANRAPAEDRASIDRLLGALEEAAARRLVLISTVDVFARPIEVDERTPPDAPQPYGAHRRLLEERCAARFDTLVVRLPGLYGPGLKKNAIYDLLHENEVEKIHPAGSFQFYGVERLWADVERALTLGLRVLHLASAPTTMGEVAQECFGRALGPAPQTPAPRYDFRSLHAAAWGGAGGYQFSKQQVLEDLRAFVARERK